MINYYTTLKATSLASTLRNSFVSIQIKKSKIIVLMLLLLSSISWGQTIPGNVFDMSTGNWTLTGWSSSVASSLYPTNGATGSDVTTGVSSSATTSNMRFWKHGTGDPLIATVATANYTAAYSSANSTIYGNGTNGIGFNGTSNSGIGSAVLSINTTGRQDIQVSWTGRTIATGARTYGIRLMYRIGTSGNFVDANSTASNIFYPASTSIGSVIMPTITLPTAANNVSIVQIMWYYYNEATTTSGSRPTLGLDDITVSSTSNVLCSGTPAPGNTIASLNPVVSGSSSVLSLQNSTSGSGVTYQWKSSPDNVTYTNISGATSNIYTATPNVATYYVCSVTCSGVTTTSNPIQVALTYCTSVGTATTYYISNVTTTSGMTNLNLTSTGAASGYINNSTTYSCSQYAGANINFSIGSIVGSGTGLSVYIDWNNNYSFLDAGEKVVGTTAYTSLNPWTSSFTIPLGTSIGSYRMRIVEDYNSSTPASCNSGISGETEDYTFMVVAAPTCYTPTSLTSSSITDQTAIISWAAPTNGTAPAGYQYEVRTSGAAGSGATGLAASGNITAPTISANVSGLTAATAYSYYVRSDCGSGDFSTWSNAGVFTTACSLPNNVSGITYSLITSTTASMSYTAAAPVPTTYVVFSSTSSVLPAISNGTTYATSTNYTIGGQTYRCLVNASTGTSWSLTGLTSNSNTYYYVFSSNSTNTCFGAPWYSTGIGSNIITCPAVPTSPIASAVSTVGATITWTASIAGGNNGTINYTFELYSDSSFTTAITGSPFSTGTDVFQVITGLNPGTTYYYKIKANNGTCDSTYLTGNFSTLKLEPTNQITNLAAGSFSASSIPLTWTAAATGSQSPDGYLVKSSSVDLISISDPVDGTDPADITVFTSTAANKKQTTGTVTSTTGFTGTTPGTMYHYKVYSYTNSGTGINFKTDNPATLSHATKPNAVSSTLASETITSSSIGFSWSSTSYLSPTNEYLVFAKAASGITSGTPVLNPSNYTPNTTLGSGTAYEADANAFCVYKGDGSSINLTGLNASTTYYFLIYVVVDAANSNGSYSYATGTSVNRTTLQIPAQLPYIDNFSTNNFIFVNGTINVWAYGSATGNSANAIYISNDSGVSNSYTLTSAKTVQAYRDITIPSGTTLANLSFDWKSNGEATYDYLRVWLVPTTFLPTAGTQITAAAGRIQIGTNFNGVTTWQNYSNTTLNISTFANSTMRLVFEWINDGSGGSQSPAAVDNISLSLPNNTWTGTTSSSWSTASNWSANSVPTTTDNIVISSNGTNAPILDADVTIPVGKSLTISGTGTTLSIAPGKTLTIAGSADFGGKSVTFKSDASGSGMFGPLTGTLTGATNVKVERYIPAKRAYRFLSPSVTTTTTINQNWQETFGTTAGLGTHITGDSGTTNGFDVTATNNPSLFTFNATTAAWEPVVSTTATTLFAGTAYRLMVRGDRNTELTNNTATATATTLRATGTLKTGNFSPIVNQAADGFSFVGNPYQAPVDIKAVLTAATNMNSGVVYYWDPTLNTRGGYVTRDLTANTNDIIISSFNQYLQPGQAVFVKKASTATAASMTFLESNKAIANAAAGVFRNTDTPVFGLLRANLRASIDNQWQAIEGALALFNPSFSTSVTQEDAAKMSNLDEEVSFVQNSTALAIACQPNPSITDELPIKFNNIRHSNYQWQFELDNYNGATPYLFDAQNNTFTVISNGTIVPFTADATTANRFKIVFQNAALNNPEFATTIVMYPNPAKNGSSFVLQGVSPKSSVVLYTTLGQSIAVSTTEYETGLQVTPKTLISSGVYIVSITTEGKTSQVKWIVE